MKKSFRNNYTLETYPKSIEEKRCHLHHTGAVKCMIINQPTQVGIVKSACPLWNSPLLHTFHERRFLFENQRFDTNVGDGKHTESRTRSENAILPVIILVNAYTVHGIEPTFTALVVLLGPG